MRLTAIVHEWLRRLDPFPSEDDSSSPVADIVQILRDEQADRLAKRTSVQMPSPAGARTFDHKARGRKRDRASRLVDKSLN